MMRALLKAAGRLIPAPLRPIARRANYLMVGTLSSLRERTDLRSLPLFSGMFVKRVGSHLRNLDNEVSSLDGIIDLAFSFRYLGVSIRPGQVKEEIRQLLKVLQETRARVVVEIGTWQGGTLFLFARVAQPNAIIISVDLPRGPFGAGYPQWKARFYESFAGQGQKIYLVRGDSHDPKSLHEVASLLNGKAIDLLFIDGDHTYEGVKKDFETYKGLLRDGGIVAFHDICKHPPETLCEVSRFWNEIKNSHRHTEIVKDWNQGHSGIGVIYL